MKIEEIKLSNGVTLQNVDTVDDKDYLKSAGVNILEIELIGKKENKLTQIKKSKKLYQNRSVPVEIDGTTYYFFGGETNYLDYKTAYDGALLKKLDYGEVSTEDGMLVINKANMENALGLIFSQLYNGWRKEKYYIEAINNATTIEEVEAIVWEDEYKG